MFWRDKDLFSRERKRENEPLEGEARKWARERKKERKKEKKKEKCEFCWKFWLNAPSPPWPRHVS